MDVFKFKSGSRDDEGLLAAETSSFVSGVKVFGRSWPFSVGSLFERV